MRTAAGFVYLICLPLWLAGCGQSAPQPVAFPDQIGDFTRDPLDAPDPSAKQANAGQSAAYTLDPEDPVTATVRIGSPRGGGELAPALDLGGDNVDQAMEKVGLVIRRFYPDARLAADEPLYLARDTGLQEGRHQTWQYQDEFLGSRRRLAMDVVISCCNNQGELVSVWLRHRADRSIERDMLGFLNELPWD